MRSYPGYMTRPSPTQKPDMSVAIGMGIDMIKKGERDVGEPGKGSKVGKVGDLRHVQSKFLD